MAMIDKLHAILKKYWGYDSFRPTQLETIETVCRGVDTLALMPTGGGKSLLYQVPTMLREGTCIVVTPLISLMKDQVDRLKKQGISALAIHSGLTPRQIDIALDNCVYGDVKFLYLAPERLASEPFRLRVQRMKVSLLAVDEAHCISQWGYDFRPSYLRIADIRKLIPEVPILALTASATERVAEDIMDKLQFKDGVLLRSSFARPNLSFVVRQTDDKDGQMLRVINQVGGAGIVYGRTRDGVEKLAKLLQENGVSADYYHGGLTNVMRNIKQDAWTSGQCRVMVATNAFGMGIDKASVRFVVHYDICDSLEEYYQEAGRAGRDGVRSYAVLLTSSDDKGRAVKRFEHEFPSMEKIRECYEAIFNYLQIGIGEGKNASFAFNIFDFAQRSRLFAQTALNAIKILQQNGYMNLTDETENPPRIIFTVSRDDLYRIRVEREELDHLLRVVLRLYSGLFNDFVAIDEAEIAQVSGYKIDRVRELLKKLWQLRVIRYIPSNVSPLLFLTEERLPIPDLYISPQSYQLRKEMTADRIESVFSYISSVGECRSKFIQSYFGEKDAQECGCCDICLSMKKKYKEQPSLEEQIIELSSTEDLTVKKMVDRFTEEAQDVISVIDRLLEEGKLTIDSGGKLRKMWKNDPVRF